MSSSGEDGRTLVDHQNGEQLMAVEVVENSETRTIEVRASGKLTADDYQLFEPGVVQLIRNSGKIKILFVMCDFHGWDVEGVWEDLKFATTHFRDIEKIAMVGEKTWEHWMAAICEPFTLSSVRYFDAGDDNAARAWLAE
jgi:hypothetical protein